ncbi:hypothetical protein ASD58_29160 [Duganella sp. Root1480D1]|nr:hypothetical protein ASD58_29160 [Duganella sp. Root1480D1]
MLALPLQALAGVAQLSCGIGEHQPRQSLRHDLKAVKKVATAQQGLDHAACGACAACCCASAALPGLNLAPAPWDGTDSHFALPPSLHAGHVPDGPERPPRHPAS